MYFSDIQQTEKNNNMPANVIIDVNIMQDKLVDYITKHWFVELTTNILNFCNREDLDINAIKDIIPKPVLKELELIGIEKGILKRPKSVNKILLQ